MALPIWTATKPKRLVCTTDPSTGTPSEVPTWREWQASDGGATVFTARWLSHAQLADCYSHAGRHEQQLRASELGVVSVDWPGGPAVVEEALAALPYLERLTLGAWIMTASLLPPDPTARPG